MDDKLDLVHCQIIVLKMRGLCFGTLGLLGLQCFSRQKKVKHGFGFRKLWPSTTKNTGRIPKYPKAKILYLLFVLMSSGNSLIPMTCWCCFCQFAESPTHWMITWPARGGLGCAQHKARAIEHLEAWIVSGETSFFSCSCAMFCIFWPGQRMRFL